MKTVLITGASRGIGAQTARVFAQAGWQVAVNYNLSASHAHRLVEEIRSAGGTAMDFRADVSDLEQVNRMVKEVQRSLGEIDALVNNAAIAQQKLFTDITPYDWDRMFDVNVKGVYHCCKAVLPGMIRRHEGCIVNLSSIWGITGGSCEVHYSATKGAVIALTKALAKEVGPSGIRVNCVAPGVIDTEMNQQLDEQALAQLREETPLGIIGSCDQVAKTILFLASQDAGFITGQVISPNGGLVI